MEILRSRGMSIENPERARRYLSTIGYYALSGYWYPMRIIETRHGEQVRLDEFLPGASFERAIALYTFDRHLRLLSLEALERVERAVKVDLAYHLGELDSFAHANPNFMDPKFGWEVLEGSSTPHSKWLDRHHAKFDRTSHVYLKQFKEKYGLPLPIWVAIEAMDFGDVSLLLSNLLG